MQKHKTISQHPKSFAFIKIALLTAGAFLAIYSALMIPLINFNAGIVFVFAAGIALFLAGVFFETIRQIKWVLYFFSILIILILVLMIFIACYGLNDTADYTEDAVLVLGSGIKGETVAPQLALRLDTAVEYCRQNTKAVIIVSGGQGPQETITEALAMERYLISKGIPPSRIIKEEESVSTYTNLSNSKKILDEHFETDYKTLLITTNYHMYRAAKTAEKIDFDINRLHSPTVWYEVPIRYLRECAAVLKLWVTATEKPN